MTFAEYQKLAIDNKFDEFPKILYAGMCRLQDFASFEEADIDLRIHLIKVALCRNFSPLGTHEVLDDHIWLLKEFLKEVDQDLIRPWSTSLIRTALVDAQSDDQFVKGVMAANTLFGIIETNARFLLQDEGSKEYYDYKFQETAPIGIGNAITKLKKSKKEIGRVLSEIDKRNIERLKEMGFSEMEMKNTRIADRLINARNPMLHGENHSYYFMCRYLSMIYMLFHFCKKKSKLSVINEN